MDFLRRLFGSDERQRDDAIHLYVACGRCQAVVHVRVDPRNDLMPEYGDGDDLIGYRLIKEIMDSRCFRLMRAEIDTMRVGVRSAALSKVAHSLRATSTSNGDQRNPRRVTERIVV